MNCQHGCADGHLTTTKKRRSCSVLTCERCSGITFIPRYEVTIRFVQEEEKPYYERLSKEPIGLTCGTCGLRYEIDFDGEIVKEQVQ